MSGRLVLCATPIGNLGDASARLGQTLSSMDVVYAEDTRHSSKLLSALGVNVALRSFFVGNERDRMPELREALSAGKAVGLITDAGTPAVSDPGRLAVAAAREVGAKVTVVPGPSAVTAAVAGSGMVEGPFVFVGFLERKGRERHIQLEAIASDSRPSVLFLSPHRVVADLADLASACGGDREICVARELTKIHEEFWWGTLDDAAERWGSEKPRGEFTVVVAGEPPEVMDSEAALMRASQLVNEGMSPSQAARQAASESGVSRRLIYDGLLRR